MEIADRIQLLMEAEGMNAARFAEEIGVIRSAMSHIFSERNRPSLDFILKILNRFPNLSPDWLLLGQGAMYRNQNDGSNGPEQATKERVGERLESDIGIAPDPNHIVFFFSDGTFRSFRNQKENS